MDDVALLRASAAGDAQAFARFMHTHQAAVFRYLLALTSREADAEDALQETFIRAWRSAGRYAGTGPARAWLYAIGRNEVRHQVRRRVGEPATLESLDSLAMQAGWGAEPEISSDGDAIIARETLQSAMRLLPPDECEVLTLRELDGFSGDETAALLDLSLAAMKSRLHRARIHLAAAVRALETPNEGGTADA